jgi:hypothetical protein
MVQSSLAVGLAVRKLRGERDLVDRWQDIHYVGKNPELIQIQSQEEGES